MSLIMLAVSTCICKALDGKTLAGSRVLESDPTALRFKDDGTAETPVEGPFVNVFVHESEVTGDYGLFRNGTLEITLVTGVTASMWATDKQTGESTLEGVAFARTTGSMDRLLNLLHRQIVMALSDETDPWAVLFRSLVPSLSKVERIGVVSMENGQRLAARQAKISGDAIDDPKLDDIDEFYAAIEAEEGAVTPPAKPYAKFLWLLHQSEQPQDRVLETEILSVMNGGAVSWSAMLEEMGLTQAGMTALGIGPVDWDNPDQVVDAAFLNGAALTGDG
ncbi:hypothetical protein [uncultured Cohaesibacter sp.]|uniref:hypothetical protein n=1 Tax=uncultured Cohaesibacter sp. TaxID=1002546 RepID=UPI0029C782D5|nr:hypothetical protein [uncultured Cohaesibacter sp.]